MGMLQVHAKVSDCIRKIFCYNWNGCGLVFALSRYHSQRHWRLEGPGSVLLLIIYGMKNNKNLPYKCLRDWKDWNMLDLESRLSTHLTGKKKLGRSWHCWWTKFCIDFAIYKYKVHLKFIWPRFAQWHCHCSSPVCKPQLNVPPKGLSHHIRCQEVKEDYE